MKDSEFTKLLKKAAILAYKHREILSQIGDICEEMYGTNYSDVDADGIIDVLDYEGQKNAESINARWFHKQMKNSGCERMDKNEKDDGDD